MIDNQVEAIEVGPPITQEDSPEMPPVVEVLKSCIAVYQIILPPLLLARSKMYLPICPFSFFPLQVVPEGGTKSEKEHFKKYYPRKTTFALSLTLLVLGIVDTTVQVNIRRI